MVLSSHQSPIHLCLNMEASHTALPSLALSFSAVDILVKMTSAYSLHNGSSYNPQPPGECSTFTGTVNGHTFFRQLNKPTFIC